MHEYHNILRHILRHGTASPSRAILPSTGKPVGTIAVFGHQARFDLRETFPAVTGKKLFWKGVVGELLWFLSGSTNVKPLQDMGVNIWNEWSRKDGELGPVYGFQWRHWGGEFRKIASFPFSGEVYDPGIDQIKNIIEGIKKDPAGRRHILSAWNVADIPKMALPPCHLMAQFRVLKNELHCMMTIRSNDAFLGLPFNIASYALLTHLIGKATGYPPGELVVSFGDLHIYDNHLGAVEEYLSRPVFPLPTLSLTTNKTDIDSWVLEDIKLMGYQSHSAITAEIAV